MKIIELLDKSHHRDSFNCGNKALNGFLQQIARQHIQKGISRTFVLVDTEQPKTILGFFTLSLCEVRADKLPSQIAKKYPSKVSGVTANSDQTCHKQNKCCNASCGLSLWCICSKTAVS